MSHMTDCAFCGERVYKPTAASIERDGEKRYYHHETESPTCYEKASWVSTFKVLKEEYGITVPSSTREEPTGGTDA